MSKPQNNQENLALCICAKCPLYTECNKDKKELLFCANSKSDCDMDIKKMCICGMCKVFKDNKLAGGYFCKNEIIN